MYIISGAKANLNKFVGNKGLGFTTISYRQPTHQIIAGSLSGSPTYAWL